MNNIIPNFVKYRYGIISNFLSLKKIHNRILFLHEHARTSRKNKRMWFFASANLSPKWNSTTHTVKVYGRARNFREPHSCSFIFSFKDSFSDSFRLSRKQRSPSCAVKQGIFFGVSIYRAPALYRLEGMARWPVAGKENGIGKGMQAAQFFTCLTHNMGRALYINGLHMVGRNLPGRNADFTLGF